MSNRIRIVFHCSLEGPVAHIGKRALQEMERHIKYAAKVRSGKSGGWVPQREWIRRGKPDYIERRLEVRIDGTGIYYHLPSNESLQVPERQPIPKFKALLDRVKWLWEALPEAIREHSQLIVTRENRRSCWQRSQTNPQRHGWGLPPAKTPSGKAYMASEEPFSDDGWKKSTTSSAALDFEGKNPWLDPHDFEAPLSPAVQHYKDTVKELLKNKQSKSLKKNPLTADANPATGQIAGQSASQTSPYHVKHGNSQSAAIAEEPSVPSIAPNSKASEAAKPKLRIGIWS